MPGRRRYSAKPASSIPARTSKRERSRTSSTRTSVSVETVIGKPAFLAFSADSITYSRGHEQPRPRCPNTPRPSSHAHGAPTTIMRLAALGGIQETHSRPLGPRSGSRRRLPGVRELALDASGHRIVAVVLAPRGRPIQTSTVEPGLLGRGWRDD